MTANRIVVVKASGDGAEFVEIELSADVCSMLGCATAADLRAWSNQVMAMPNVTIGETAVIAILAGVRKVTVSVTGVAAGSNYLLFPISATPAGYAIADVVATAANTLQVTITVPAIALGQSYSIPCRVIRLSA